MYTMDANGIPISATLPRFAFKFAPPSPYALEALREKYIWFSQPDQLNDVSELPGRVRTDYSESELFEYCATNIRHFFPHFDQGYFGAAPEKVIRAFVNANRSLLIQVMQDLDRSRRDRVRICCMSMCYDNPLLWAHYAAGFTGFCLVFDFPLLVESGPWFAVRVKYVSSLPDFDPVAESLQQHAAEVPYSDMGAQLRYDQIRFGQKFDAWAYEQEVRLCTPASESKQSYPVEALRGVILGPRTTAAVETAVLDATRDVSGHAIIRRVHVDDKDGSLRVAGLENEFVTVPMAGVRNLSTGVIHYTTGATSQDLPR